MLGELVSEIVLVDIQIEKTEGEVMDMNHGVSFVAPVKITAGTYSDAKGSDMVIITAGASQKKGEKRIDLLKRNTAIFKSIVDELMKYCRDDTIILVVTNPVDIMAYITYKLSGFSKNHIIGSGTVLDTSRLKYMISEHTNIDARNVHTYIIGEHGDTEVAAWSVTNIAGVSIDDYCSICKGCEVQNIEKNKLLQMTKDSAYEIIERKGATYYAVALAVRRIVECIIGNENSILTVSSLFNGQYGIDDVFLSVPTLVNAKGADRILEVPFSDKEISDLKKSASTIKGLIRDIGF
ncbi:l-2-hydroxycarboxylate dehydrogenase (nad(p)(+)) [Holotrichia oblita]|nr:l-2-hydroxycarboxylate dehydrogenase (nad(p)(+)) [Holotrichia oblita]